MKKLWLSAASFTFFFVLNGMLEFHHTDQEKEKYSEKKQTHSVEIQDILEQLTCDRETLLEILQHNAGYFPIYIEKLESSGFTPEGDELKRVKKIVKDSVGLNKAFQETTQGHLARVCLFTSHILTNNAQQIYFLDKYTQHKRVEQKILETYYMQGGKLQALHARALEFFPVLAELCMESSTFNES